MSSSNAKAKYNWNLDETQCPSVLSRAATRARDKWKDPESRDKALKSAGSPGFKPTHAQGRQVEAMTAMGMNPRDISRVLGIDKHLVEFFYEYELKTAAARTNMAVGKSCLEMALDKQHPDITKFWLQCRAGWAPKQQIDHTGVDKDADDARAAREALLSGDDVQTPSQGGESQAGSET